MSDELFGDSVDVIESLQREIESNFLTRLSLEADVRFVSPRSRARSGEEGASEVQASEGNREPS